MPGRGACQWCDSPGNGECSDCHGTGTTVHLNSLTPECPHCRGTGKCPDCRGTGLPSTDPRDLIPEWLETAIERTRSLIRKSQR